MKKVLLTALILSLLLPLVSMFNIPTFAAVPMSEDMGGYENLCLTYTFRTSNSYDYGRHYEKDLMPYVSYIDKSGNIKDYFFDSYLFLPCMDFGPSGARMHVDVNNPTKAIDWTAYVEDTFYQGANVDALETAFGKAKDALDDSDKKAGVFFTILYPCANATNFGTLGGKKLNFSKTEDRKYAIKWIIDEQIKLFNEGNYNNLELVGFYWLEEFLVNDDDVELFQYASEYLHSKGLKFIWIPWYQADGFAKWKTLGIDVACMQPNQYWMGYFDPNRVTTSANISKKHGMGMEIELDARVTQDDYYNRYLDYLEGGLETGMMNGVKMYYQDGKPAVYYQAANSSDERYRSVYDLTYKYAKGTLTKEDITAVRPDIDSNYVDDIDFTESILLSGITWFSIGKSYTGCASYVDGNGMAYQDVDGKELTDGIIAKEAVSTDWHAFHTSIRDRDWRMSVIIDLGETRDDITNFAAHFDNRQEYGIGAPTNILLYYSVDGENYRYINAVDLIMDSTDSCINYKCSPITARYIKLSFVPADKGFVFCSEFLVGTSLETEENDGGNTNDNSQDNENDNVDNSGTENSDTDADSENKNNNDKKSNNTGLIITIVVAVVVLIAVVVVVVIIIKKRRK